MSSGEDLERFDEEDEEEDEDIDEDVDETEERHSRMFPVDIPIVLVTANMQRQLVQFSTLARIMIDIFGAMPYLPGSLLFCLTLVISCSTCSPFDAIAIKLND